MKTSNEIPSKDRAKLERRSMKAIKTEADLVNLYLRTTQKRRSKQTIVTTEFDCENGIADIVLANLTKNWRSYSLIGCITPRWAFALKDLPYRRVFSLDTFRALSGTSSSRARAALNEFTKAGYCQQKNSKQEWIKIKEPRQIVTEIRAIEAKLKDWSRALIQAHRYLDFADESIVLLDHAYVHVALENLRAFKALGVSLASISNDGKIYNHFQASKIEPRSKIRRWQSNAILALKLTNNHQNIA